METKLFVGVDISKENLGVAIGPQTDIITFSNDQNGVDALVKKLSRMDPEPLGLPAFGIPRWQIVTGCSRITALAMFLSR